MQKYLTLFVQIVIAICGVVWLTNWSLSLRQPYTWSKVWVDPIQIEEGDTANFYYTYTRHYYCNTDLNRYIKDVNTGAIVWRDRTIGGAGLLGEQTVLNPIKMSPDIVPGEYKLLTIVYSTCENGVHSDSWPEIYFQVIQKK